MGTFSAARIWARRLIHEAPLGPRLRGALPTPDIADVQTREYWRCLPLAAHFWFTDLRLAPGV
jgi:hypothetical protein